MVNETVTTEDLIVFKRLLEERLCSIVMNDEDDNAPNEIKPYIKINPYSDDAQKQIDEINENLCLEKMQQHPDWIRHLINKGYIDIDCKTVLSSNLATVASEIRDYTTLPVTQAHLSRFVKSKDKKPYSKSQIKKVLIGVN